MANKSNCEDWYNTIMASQECFEITSTFWSLLDRNVCSKTSAASVINMFMSVCRLFKLSSVQESVGNYVYEQLYFSNIRENELLDCNVRGKLLYLTLKDAQTGKSKDTRQLSEEAEQADLKSKFNEITFEQFYKLLISFFCSTVLNCSAENYTSFWEYVYLRIIECKSETEEIPIPQVSAVYQPNVMPETEQVAEYSIAWCTEDIIRDRSLIYEKEMPTGVKRRFLNPKEVRSIGHYCDLQINEFINSNFSGLKENWQTFRNLMNKQLPIYIFFTVTTGDSVIFLNPATYEKYMFEEVYFQDKNELVWCNLIDREAFLKVNHERRFDQLIGKGANPYYFEKLAKLNFEIEGNDVGARLVEGNLFYQRIKCLLQSNNGSQKTEKKQADFMTNSEGIETLIKQKSITFDEIANQRTDNYSYNRLLEIAIQKQPRILIIGKPYSGKTNLAKVLSNVLKIERLDIEESLQAELKNIEAVAQDFQDRMTQEMSEEERTAFDAEYAKVKDSIEEYESLAEGSEVSTSLLKRAIINKLQTLGANYKGFVVEFSSVLFNKGLLPTLLSENEDTMKIDYVINLKISDTDCLHRKQLTKEFRTVKEDTEIVTNITDSELQECRLHIERATYFKEGELTDELKEQYEALQPELREIIENIDSANELLTGAKYTNSAQNDDEIIQQIRQYEISDINDLKDFIIRTCPKYIGIEAEGLTIRDILKQVLSQFDYKKSESPVEITEASAVEQVLEAAKQLDQFDIRREWSFYKQIDCVEFCDNQTIKSGLAEFSVNYHNYAFLFATEDNRKRFIKNPSKYIKKTPKLDGQFNMLVVAPPEESFKEKSKAVAQRFGLKFIDMSDYILSKLAEMESQKDAFCADLKSKFEFANVNYNDIFKGIYTGDAVSTVELMKLFLLENGATLELKFDEEEETKILTEKPDPKNKKRVVQRQTKNVTISSLITNTANVRIMNDFYERIKNTELSEEAIKKIPVEPLEAKAVTPLKGFLFYNLNVNQEMSDLLSQTGVEFYKVINFYNNQSEEEPLFEHSPKDISVAKTVEMFEDAREVLRTTIPEDSLLNANWNESEFKSAERLMTDFVDPFKDKIDSDELKFNYNFEQNSQDSELMKIGDFGRACPVQLIDNHWFLECKPEVNSLQINGKLVCFSSEANKAKFAANYENYIQQLKSMDFRERTLRFRRVFIMGAIGSGLQTVGMNIAKELGMEVFDLKKHLIHQKTEYIQNRVLTVFFRNGFNAEQIDEQKKLLGMAKGSVLEILDKYEPESAEAEEAFEEELIRQALVSATRKVVLLNLCFDENERLIFKSDVKEIMQKLCLIPNEIIVLRSGDFVSHNRIFKADQLKAEWNDKLQKIKNSNAAKIEKRRLELLAERQAEDPTVQLESIEVGEADVEFEAEPIIEEEIEKVSNLIKEKRERQTEVINDYLETMKEYTTMVYQLNTELPMQKVLFGCLSFLKERAERESEHFETCQFSSVSDHPDNDELSAERKLQKMVSSLSYSLSKFGLRDYSNPKRFVTNYDNNVIYKNQIYFFENGEDRRRAIKLGKRFTDIPVNRMEALDLTVSFLKPIYDSTLRSKLKREFKLKFVSLEKAAKHVFSAPNPKAFKPLQFNDFPTRLKTVQTNDFCVPELLSIRKSENNDLALLAIKKALCEGRPLSDDQKVYLVVKYSKKLKLEGAGGIALESFPENVSQFNKLRTAGIFPTLVFTTYYKDSDIKKNQKTMASYYRNKQALTALVQRYGPQLRPLEEFCAQNFSNLITLNANKPTDSNFEIISELIDQHRESLIKAMFDYETKKLFCPKLLPISKQFLRQKMMHLGTVSVSKWMDQKATNIVQFSQNNALFYMESFIFDERPEHLRDRIHPIKFRRVPSPELPETDLNSIHCRADMSNIKSASKFENACSVCHSKRKANKGHAHLTLKFNEQNFFFCSLIHLHKFFVHPKLYSAQKVDQSILEKVRDAPVVISNEKRVIDELSVVMNHICKLKLKYPMMTVKQTALNLLAIFLKYRNPLKDDRYRAKYEKKLNRFIADCQEVNRLGTDIDQSKKSYKNYEMNVLQQKIDEFMERTSALKEEGVEGYMRRFLE